SNPSIVVDDGLVRRMARDAAAYSLTRPAAIVMWIALLGALTLSVVTLVTVTSAGGEVSSILAWIPVFVVVLLAMSIIFTVSSARRALRAAMPPGSVVWVAVG